MHYAGALDALDNDRALMSLQQRDLAEFIRRHFLADSELEQQKAANKLLAHEYKVGDHWLAALWGFQP